MKKNLSPLLVLIIGALGILLMVISEFDFLNIKAAFGENATSLLSKLAIPIIAASVFFFMSNYFPKILSQRNTKEAVLLNVIQMNVKLQSEMQNLRFNLNIENLDIRNYSALENELKNIDPNTPNNTYLTYYEYFDQWAKNCSGLISRLLQFKEYYRDDILIEILILDRNLRNNHLFSGKQIIASNDLVFGSITIQELLIHSEILHNLLCEEEEKSKNELKAFIDKYREKNLMEKQP